jgi:hypothetical protein
LSVRLQAGQGEPANGGSENRPLLRGVEDSQDLGFQSRKQQREGEARTAQRLRRRDFWMFRASVRFPLQIPEYVRPSKVAIRALA